MATIQRGEVYFADLDPVIGSEQGGQRPVLILQNDVGNRFSPTVIVAAITSRLDKTPLPTHIAVNTGDREGLVLLEQLRTIDKRRLSRRIAVLSGSDMRRVDAALKVSMDIT